jgi:4-hydroxy-3-methylbut-2-enyl diphosphate reductase
MRVLLANPRSFCAGVHMAIDSLEKALELLGRPVYVYHEIIHNKYVVDRFRDKGVVFVDDLAEVPFGATLFYSAHGVSPEVRRQAAERRLRTIDATCPLVTRVHRQAVHYARQDYTMVLIGHVGHDEIVGTLGEAPGHIKVVGDAAEVDRLRVPDETRVAYLTQTTLSLDDAARIVHALRRRFPGIVGPARGDICYASQNRQEAVKALAAEADVVLVLGSQNSSNSQRLREIAEAEGKRAYLIDGAREIQPGWFHPDDVVLVTAGASAPEESVRECVAYLCDRFGATVEEHAGRPEHATFPMPRELQALADSRVSITVDRLVRNETTRGG